MFEVRINREFDAAHFLPGHAGKCANMHGHTWRVDLTIRGDSLDDGMVVDFVEVNEVLAEVLPDHTLLNDILPNPTAENLAEHLYRAIKERIKGLVKVVVWESSSTGAAFFES
ncbi:MAG: 6-carboxytetrahydropterin synthase QueD [Chloroflexi bacterium]|nr:6-carboxytetrahydropterin synthase QueD [Chloroflexota bacterium]